MLRYAQHTDRHDFGASSWYGMPIMVRAMTHPWCHRRKCRRLLATSLNVVPLSSAAGRSAFCDRRSVKGNTLAVDESADSSVFVEPMRWMADEITGAVQGKLYCPGCGNRLGSFNWAGGQRAQHGQWGQCGQWAAACSLRGAWLNTNSGQVGPCLVSVPLLSVVRGCSMSVKVDHGS
jgi:hypothetical protein